MKDLRDKSFPEFPRVSIHTLGCKVNQYDAASIETALKKEGFAVSPTGGEADVVVVNTCTVTGASDSQNRKLIRRLRAAHPSALLVVTGCQAEVSPGSLRRMAEVDLVVGNDHKAELPRRIRGVLARGAPSPDRPMGGDAWGEGVDRLPGHTRAFLKVQDGCDASCAYCIVPRARGPSRSRPLGSVLEELRRMERSGIREVVLTGIHLGSYGADLAPPETVSSLLDRVLGACDIPRIRLSSLEPLEASAELLGRMGASERICPHLHLPLQSGDDHVLRRMNRPYTTAQYRERALEALAAVPSLTLGADVIVGFPGETEDGFRRSVRFLESIPFTYLHVFPFSPRPGTLAFDLPHRVAPREIKERARLLREMSRKRRVATLASHVGRTLPVLVERATKGRERWMEGLTANYLRVLLPGDESLRNRILPVRMECVHEAHLIGKPADL